MPHTRHLWGWARETTTAKGRIIAVQGERKRTPCRQSDAVTLPRNRGEVDDKNHFRITRLAHEADDTLGVILMIDPFEATGVVGLQGTVGEIEMV